MKGDIEKIFALNEQIQQQLDIIQHTIQHGYTPWMNKKEAAAYLGMSTKSLDRYMDKIPHSRSTGRPKFHKKDLDEFMESSKTEIY